MLLLLILIGVSMVTKTPLPFEVSDVYHNWMEGGYNYYNRRGQEVNKDGFLIGFEGALFDAEGYMVERAGNSRHFRYERVRHPDIGRFMKH